MKRLRESDNKKNPKQNKRGILQKISCLELCVELSQQKLQLRALHSIRNVLFITVINNRKTVLAREWKKTANLIHYCTGYDSSIKHLGHQTDKHICQFDNTMCALKTSVCWKLDLHFLLCFPDNPAVLWFIVSEKVQISCCISLQFVCSHCACVGVL